MAPGHHLIELLRSAMGNQGGESQTAHWARLAIGLLAYIVVSRLIIRNTRGLWREISFAAVNLAALHRLLFHGTASGNTFFVIYLALICFQYLMLRAFGEKKGALPWLAFFTPIAALVVVRYTPWANVAHLTGLVWLTNGLGLIGISYLAFRTSRLGSKSATVPSNNPAFSIT
jgi:hypothetical protein